MISGSILNCHNMGEPASFQHVAMAEAMALSNVSVKKRGISDGLSESARGKLHLCAD